MLGTKCVHPSPRFYIIKANKECGINLNILGLKVHEEGLKWFWYTASVFDLVQQRTYNFPVVDTAADVFLLVVVRVHSITLGY